MVQECRRVVPGRPASWQNGRPTSHNPTPFPARVTILSEDAAQAAEPFAAVGCDVLPVVELALGATTTW